MEPETSLNSIEEESEHSKEITEETYDFSNNCLYEILIGFVNFTYEKN